MKEYDKWIDMMKVIVLVVILSMIICSPKKDKDQQDEELGSTSFSDSKKTTKTERQHQSESSSEQHVDIHHPFKPHVPIFPFDDEVANSLESSEHFTKLEKLMVKDYMDMVKGKIPILTYGSREEDKKELSKGEMMTSEEDMTDSVRRMYFLSSDSEEEDDRGDKRGEGVVAGVVSSQSFRKRFELGHSSKMMLDIEGKTKSVGTLEDFLTRETEESLGETSVIPFPPKISHHHTTHTETKHGHGSGYGRRGKYPKRKAPVRTTSAMLVGGSSSSTLAVKTSEQGESTTTSTKDPKKNQPKYPPKGSPSSSSSSSQP